MGRLSKRTVDLLAPGQQEYFVWDDDLIGFGVRVQPSGAKSFVVKYRAGRGRAAPTRRITIGPTTRLSSEAARSEAKRLISRATLGQDPATDSARDRQYPDVAELADRFITEHLKAKRKASTAAWAQDVFDRIIKPELGRTRADLVKYEAVAALHGKWRHTPFQANRTIALISSMYAFAERLGLIPMGHNPAKHIQKYRESARERFLTTDELKRLGSAIREASTVGIEWPAADDSKPNSKHAPKDPVKRRTWLSPHAAAGLKLLLLTGARVGEILNLRWEDVDFERGIAFLPDSKTGRKPLLLNSAAMQILSTLPRYGRFVVAGEHLDKPRHDLKRPFALVCRRARLDGVRIHDLRHTFASFGAGGGYGLPIIGKLLGHTQASTTNRYAHLHMDPVRRAADGISDTIAAALDWES